jgi:hypothetical protein
LDADWDWIRFCFRIGEVGDVIASGIGNLFFFFFFSGFYQKNNPTKAKEGWGSDIREMEDVS